MTHYRKDGSNSVEQTPLAVGEQIRLDGGDERRWWTVRAVSAHFAVVVRQAPFLPRGVVNYTVLDWRNGVRGPCNLVGQGYGDGSYSEEECAEMLLDFEYDHRQDPAYLTAVAAGGGEYSPARHGLEVSHRNWLPLAVLEHRRTPTAA